MNAPQVFRPQPAAAAGPTASGIQVSTHTCRTAAARRQTDWCWGGESWPRSAPPTGGRARPDSGLIRPGRGPGPCANSGAADCTRRPPAVRDHATLPGWLTQKRPWPAGRRGVQWRLRRSGITRPRPDGRRRYRAACWPTDGELTVSGDRGSYRPGPDGRRRYRAAGWPTDGEHQQTSW